VNPSTSVTSWILQHGLFFQWGLGLTRTGYLVLIKWMNKKLFLYSLLVNRSR
jgi:hypothetical protein